MTTGDVAPAEHRLTVERSARVYTLGSTHAREAWVVLHGYGQLAARFIGNFDAIAGAKRVIVAPEALNRFYIELPRPGGPPAADRRVGTTWMTREDREAEIADYVAYLDRVRSQVVPQARHLTVLGFSQGVATACRWVALGSTPVQRLILWGGVAPPDLDLGLLANRMAGKPVELVMGSHDPMGESLDQQLAALREAGIEPQLTPFAGAHIIDAGALARLTASA